MKSDSNPTIKDFLNNKSELTQSLFQHFVNQYKSIGQITLTPTRTMIGISSPTKRIAWITQLGKNFIHVVFPFKQSYPDNLCFQKIAQVPGDDNQFNHHLRIFNEDDINGEVLKYMKLAYTESLKEKTS